MSVVVDIFLLGTIELSRAFFSLLARSCNWFVFLSFQNSRGTFTNLMVLLEGHAYSLSAVLSIQLSIMPILFQWFSRRLACWTWRCSLIRHSHRLLIVIDRKARHSCLISLQAWFLCALYTRSYEGQVLVSGVVVTPICDCWWWHVIGSCQWLDKLCGWWLALEETLLHELLIWI